MNSIRILLVDDHELVRSALSGQLSTQPDFDIVGEAADAQAAIAGASEHRPDVLLMDIDMPGMICFDAARRIVSRFPETKIIFVSAFFHDHYIDQALKVRARGYLRKSEPIAQLMAAIREVAAGGVWFSEEVSARIVVGEGSAALDTATLTCVSTLSDREVEVLRYLARGMSKKQVAATMHLSPKTIDNHTCRIMNKLDIHDRVELARFAIREGLAEA
ncbi:MAG: response regulator transcription factor [Planctomycetota bacterium]|jgi:DNA-binding NarL/FixJ family response regulator|nr:response regulator transcription factor [Planctomycetota bacterium]MDP6838482.1 response regulator transcription factor [Planctomycetota bacterium]